MTRRPDQPGRSWGKFYVSRESFLDNKRGTLYNRSSFLLPVNRLAKGSLQFLHKRHLTSRAFDKELLYYEGRARRNPSNVDAQLAYLKEVVKVDPEHALRWYERYRCAQLRDSSLDAVFREALQASNRHSNVGAPPAGGEMLRDAGTKEKPLYVTMNEVESKGRKFGGRFLSVLMFGFGLYLFSKIAKSISPSRALGGKEFSPEKMSHTVRFEDVQGCEEAKADLQEVVEFLRDQEKLERLSAKILCVGLLAGPPGTGKTLLACANCC